MGSPQQINKIRDLILDYYEIKEPEFFSSSRREPIATARQLFSYCLREKYKLSFPAIARIFNNDHTTAIYAYKKIKEARRKNKKLDKFIDFISGIKDEYGLEDAPTWQSIKNHDRDEDCLAATKEDDIFNAEKFLFGSDEKKYCLPIKFDENYLENIFSKLDDRKKNILKSRYQFGEGDLRTLEDIGVEQNITRERVRQIIDSTLKILFKNDFHNVGQIIYFINEKIKQDKIFCVENDLGEIFVFNQKDKNLVIKFILVIISIIKNIKQFNFSGQIFLIDIKEEEAILKEIDNIKSLIKKITSEIPDIAKNKKDYVLQSLEADEYFLNKTRSKYFLKACYDNYLFESSAIVYDREDLKKYKASNPSRPNEAEKQKIIKGVPDEYSIFFK